MIKANTLPHTVTEINPNVHNHCLKLDLVFWSGLLKTIEQNIIIHCN